MKKEKRRSSGVTAAEYCVQIVDLLRGTKQALERLRDDVRVCEGSEFVCPQEFAIAARHLDDAGTAAMLLLSRFRKANHVGFPRSAGPAER